MVSVDVANYEDVAEDSTCGKAVAVGILGMVKAVGEDRAVGVENGVGVVVAVAGAVGGTVGAY